MSSTVETVRAEALFASSLQSSERPEADDVRHAVRSTLRSLGTRGCAVEVAGEFGDRPETAVARMAWAIEMVRAVYPTSGQPTAHGLSNTLALAG
jgi:hypothetical protein